MEIERKGHYSDCAVHNEPLTPNGPCDCGGFDLPDVAPDTTITLRSEKPGALGDFLRAMNKGDDNAD